MKKQFIYTSILSSILLGLMVFSTPLIAQTALRDILHEFDKLRTYSIKYDAYRELNEPEYAERKKAHKKKYMDQINYIKKGPNRAIYIQFLNDATGKDSLRYQKQIGMHYTYLVPIRTHNIGNMPNMFEYLKAVKYSLFTLNKEELILPKDIPFLKGKL